MLTRLHRLFQNVHSALNYGAAMDTVSATATAPGAALTAATAVSGDTLQIKNTNSGTPAWLLNTWAKTQAAGMLRIRSPKLHDNVDAIRSRVQSGIVDYLTAWGFPQRLYSQDVLIVEIAGSAVGGQIEDAVLLVYYEDLQGQAQRLLDEAGFQSRFTGNFAHVRAALTTGTTAGYGGQKALNADVDLLKANTDYAVLGMSTDLKQGAICMRGPDTGNLRVSVPGELTKTHIQLEWFRRLSRDYKRPLIPIINSANKGATFIDTLGDQAGGTANVTVLLGELK
jgi:hypothetical protein